MPVTTRIEEVRSEIAALAQATGIRMLGTLRFKEPLSLAIVEQLL